MGNKRVDALFVDVADVCHETAGRVHLLAAHAALEVLRLLVRDEHAVVVKEPLAVPAERLLHARALLLLAHRAFVHSQKKKAKTSWHFLLEKKRRERNERDYDDDEARSTNTETNTPRTHANMSR